MHWGRHLSPSCGHGDPLGCEPGDPTSQTPQLPPGGGPGGLQGMLGYHTPNPPNPPSPINRMTEREVYKHNLRKFCLRAVIYLMSKTMGSDIEGSKGALDTCAPSIQMFSISYSFWDKMAQIKRLTYSPWGLAHPPHLENSVSALVR